MFIFVLYLQDVSVGQEQPEPAGAAGCRCRFGEVSVQEGAAASFKAQPRLWCCVSESNVVFPHQELHHPFHACSHHGCCSGAEGKSREDGGRLAQGFGFLCFGLVKIISV